MSTQHKIQQVFILKNECFVFLFLHSSSEDGQSCCFFKGMEGHLLTLELLDLKYDLLHCRHGHVFHMEFIGACEFSRRGVEKTF